MNFIEGEDNSIFFFGGANRNTQVLGGIEFDLKFAKLIRRSLSNWQLPFLQAHSYSVGYPVFTCPVQYLSNQASAVCLSAWFETQVDVVVIRFIEELPG
jgi:hypothetical protein